MARIRAEESDRLLFDGASMSAIIAEHGAVDWDKVGNM